MHLLACHGNGYSCNSTAKCGQGGAELMAHGDLGSGGTAAGVAQKMGWESKTRVEEKKQI